MSRNVKPHLHVIDSRDIDDIRVRTIWFDDAEEMNLARVAMSELRDVRIVACGSSMESSFHAARSGMLPIARSVLSAVAVIALTVGVFTGWSAAYAIGLVSAVIGLTAAVWEWMRL